MASTSKTTAFALAGLGGFNAHGAGFLAAASKCGMIPDMVTATSDTRLISVAAASAVEKLRAGNGQSG